MTPESNHALLSEVLVLCRDLAASHDRLLKEVADLKSQLSPTPHLELKEVLSPDEACKLLNCERHKLAQIRTKYWIKGAHYFLQSNGRSTYNGILLHDWIKNQAFPTMHQQAIDLWLSQQPAQQPRKPGRKIG